MTNSIIGLTARRRSLVDRKDQYRREYETFVRNIDEEIRHIDEFLKFVEAAAEPYRCNECGGTGQSTRADAAGSCEEVTCRKCHGTGFDLSKSRKPI